MGTAETKMGLEALLDSPLDVVYMGMMLLGLVICLGGADKRARAVRYAASGIGALTAVAFSGKIIPWIIAAIALPYEVCLALLVVLGALLGEYFFNVLLAAL